MGQKARARVFLDTNVILSLLYPEGGAPGEILRLFIEGRIEVVISRQVLEEEVRVIREKLPEALPALRTLLINRAPEIVAGAPAKDIDRLAAFLDTGDARILADAVSARTDCLVTGDRHFLEDPGISKKAGIPIVTPAQFLQKDPGSIGAGTA